VEEEPKDLYGKVAIKKKSRLAEKGTKRKSFGILHEKEEKFMGRRK
jgi:hypothetical protein